MLPLLSLIFGLIVGSFLNVVIHRLKLNRPFTGRSRCPHCNHVLGPLDLVPLFSYLFLRGRCRYCGKRISIQYPIVEGLTAMVFFLAANQVGQFTPQLGYLFAIFSVLIVIAVYDCKHYLILDKVVFPALAAVVVYSLVADVTQGCSVMSCASVSGLIGALLVSGFFFLQHLVSNGRWIGFGDVKLGLLLGFIAGFPLSLFLLFVAYVSGAVTGMFLIATGRRGMTSKLPFGTFLAFATIATLLYGRPLMNLYLNLIGYTV